MLARASKLRTLSALSGVESLAIRSSSSLSSCYPHQNEAKIHKNDSRWMSPHSQGNTINPTTIRVENAYSNIHTRSLSSSSASTATNIEKEEGPTKQQEEEPPFQPTPERKYKYFQNPTITPEGILVITFDSLTKKVNTLGFDLMNEAKSMWNQDIVNNPEVSSKVKAVVFISGKKDTFIAGADIFDIRNVEDKKDLIPLMKEGMDFFGKALKQKGWPLVCAIDGPALGGGLEWALWCDYRICTDNPKTKLGLPEVKLGLLPGFGGIENLPPLVGLQSALDMMLTGKDIRPAKAKKMGLVDLVVTSSSLLDVSTDMALKLADGTLKAKKKKKSFMNRMIEDTSIGQYIMFRQVDAMVAKNAGGNYPAPLAIVDCVKKTLTPSSGDKFDYSRQSFVSLASTTESEALIGLFDGTTRMKKSPVSSDITPRPVERVAVIGSGLMGSGIAQVSAEKASLDVLLKDRDDQSIGKGLDYMMGNWDKKVKKKRMSMYDRNICDSKIVPITDDTDSWKEHFKKCDLVIEAVFEDLTLKRNIVSQMESVTPSHCIFATNTSAIPISEIAVGAQRPDQIVGMHYFSPVPQMPLLEIVPHAGTSDETIASAFSVGTKQGKTCVVVKDVPGFYVNRCLGPYLIEVSALVKDGVSLEQLDKAMKKFGMPVGPITLADEVGVDVSYKVAKFLSEADLGVRMEGGDTTLMGKMVEKGWLGKKSDQGFYTYGGKNKKKKTINAEVKGYIKDFVERDLKLDETEIQDRIVSRFVNEATKCLEDGIISDPVAGDIGLVFGTGFAPFRGGPFRYLDTYGADKYVDLMKGFADKYGPQFEPCQLLLDHAHSGKKFHGN